MRANGATVAIKFSDARKGTIVLDVTDEEGEEMGRKGRKQARPYPLRHPTVNAKPVEVVERESELATFPRFLDAVLHGPSSS